MPIAREQFDKGVSDVGARILGFLSANPEQAFKLDEIAAGLGYTQPQEGLGSIVLSAFAIAVGVGGELDGLAKKGLVDKKAIKGTDYFSFHRK